MNPISHPSENSFETRKRIEEMALQQASLVHPSLQKLATQELSSLTSPYTISSIDSISKAQAPLPHIQEKNVNEAILSKMESLRAIPKELQKPIDHLFFEIMKLLESESASKVHTQELLIRANHEWQKSIEKEILASAERSKNLNNTTTTLSRVTQAIAPASALLAGFLTVSAGTISLSALASAAISGLFFIDSLFDDAAKKYIASILARKNQEEAKVWLQRIQIFSSILSFATSYNISQPDSLKIATKVSSAALLAVESGAGLMKTHADSTSITLNSSFEQSESFSDDLIRRSEQIMKTLSEIYRHQHDIEEATHKTCQACFINIH